VLLFNVDEDLAAAMSKLIIKEKQQQEGEMRTRDKKREGQQ
jgi:hypothetical protein